ncbi:MAG: T9SS type A sorting domain-containing protein, partial [Flammeovirgaceae bacterium]
ELSALASSGLPITYTSSNPNVATIATNKVTIVGAGSCTITASQAGNESFLAASASQPLTVSKANQTITFPALANKAITDAPFNLTASASSSLPIVYSTTSNNITLTNGAVGIVAAGRATITASQSGNPNYNAAEPVNQNFCVNPAKPSITISNLNTPNPLLTSSATEGNQWYLDGVAIAGATSATYTATKSGSYQVQVTLDGCTGEFSQHQPVVITGVEANSILIDLYPNPVTEVLSISFGGIAGKKQVTVFALTGESILSSSTESGSIEMNVANLSAGMYLARIVVNGVVQTKKLSK